MPKYSISIERGTFFVQNNDTSVLTKIFNTK